MDDQIHSPVIAIPFVFARIRDIGPCRGRVGATSSDRALRAHSIAGLDEPSCGVSGDDPKTGTSPAAEADSTEGCPAPRRTTIRGPQRSNQRSGGCRRPTALAEVDRGLSDALKVGPNPRIGV